MRTRESIYSDLQEERYFVLRHDITPRIWAVMDALLDELIELQHCEALEMLEEEANEPLLIEEISLE